MRIAKILGRENVWVGLSASTKDDAIVQLVSRMAEKRAMDPKVICSELAKSDRMGPVLIPIGPYSMALPHAATSACKQFALAVGTSEPGIDWGPLVGKAHLVIVAIFPPEAQALHLRILARIARLCEDLDLVKSLVHAKTPDDLLRSIARAEEPLGDIAPAENLPSFCILGAGNGGMAMAGHLAITGCKVNLFNRSEERLRPIRERNGLDVDGEIEGFAPMNRVTSDPAEALAGVDVAMVVVPANAHSMIAETIAEHLRDGQVLVLNPGRTGGALEVAHVLKRKNPGLRLFLAEAQTLLYAARITNPGQVRIFGIKNSVPLATLPAYHVVDVLPLIRRALPQFVPGDNVLKTSFDNIGAVFHPAITILNAGRIEDTHGDFEYYVQGVTPSVAAVLEAVDRERVGVAGALGIRANTAREWLYLAYDAAGRTLLDAMRNNRGYSGIMAPGTIQHRYISEDVPTSLVPISSIGRMLNVPTPATDAIIHMASVMHGIDYWSKGRTVERLGIAGLSVKDIRFLVVGAVADPVPAPVSQAQENATATAVFDQEPEFS